MIRELAKEGDVCMEVERMCCRFKGFQSMGREAAKKVEGWEIRRMGEFVTYIDGRSWKGLIICFLKVIMFTIGGPHKQ